MPAALALSRGLLPAALFLAPAATAQGLNVALVAAFGGTCQQTDTQSHLMATNLFGSVAIIDTATVTPTLSQLQQYQAVMVWTNATPLNSSGLGDVLADYVDSGGGVVVTVFANSTTTANRNIGGRWQNGYMVITDRSGNCSGAATLGTVNVPNHPVMAGVTAFTGGTTGSRPCGTALQPGATLIAQWSDGKVLVAEGASAQRIDLGFYPPSTVCSPSGWATGGDLLMANALVYVATAAAYQKYGVGCPGSLGVPTLDAGTGLRPILGTTFSATLGNLPLSVGIVSIGFSRTQYGPFPLPLDLGQFGMPGCSLFAEALATQFVAGSGNSATWSINLPSNPAFVGMVFYNQGFALDPGFNAAGLTVSNAGRARLNF